MLLLLAILEKTWSENTKLLTVFTDAFLVIK
jgi:hypothetical protein